MFRAIIHVALFTEKFSNAIDVPGAHRYFRLKEGTQFEVVSVLRQHPFGR
jgi:hypothetical protein